MKDLANNIYSRQLYKTDKHIAAIIVNVIDICNYNCYYCYNKKPRLNILLDLNKLFLFIQWFINNINNNVILFILGGEPTLHPQLFDFCKKLKITYLDNVNCRIVTNFSQPLSKTLEMLNCGIQMNASWHSLPNDRCNKPFIEKIDKIPLEYFNRKQIEIVTMYEKLYDKYALSVFDYFYEKIPANVTLTPVENNHLHGKWSELYRYSDQQNKEYYRRIQNQLYISQHAHNSIIYEYDTYTASYVTQQIYFNKSLSSFKNYKCFAGIDQIYIHFNGDIAPCDDLYEKNILLGNIYSGKFDKSKFHFRICQLDECPCPFFSKKQKIGYK